MITARAIPDGESHLKHSIAATTPSRNDSNLIKGGENP